MIRDKDIDKIIFTGDRLDLIKHMSIKLTIGGYSNVYEDQEYRDMKLEETQLTGQLGEAATMTSRYSWEMYRKYSIYRKKGGDGGSDIPSASVPIDVKTSNVHIPDFNNVDELLYARKLSVAPAEYNPNIVYVSCVVPESPSHSDISSEVWVMGWCFGHEMEEEFWDNPNTETQNHGFRRKMSKLQPLSFVPFCAGSWFNLLEDKRAA